MAPIRIFLSFDLEHDSDLRDRLVAQSREGLVFAIADQSEDGAMTDAWTERARTRIAASDEVLVLCGEHTDKSSRMGSELRIAQELKKPYVLIWGRRDHMCKRPKSARSCEGMYIWRREILEDQITSVLSWTRRNSTPAARLRRS
jgi:hypothetical protein